MRLIDADELNAIKEKLRIFDSFISTVTRQCTDEHQAIYEHWIDCRYDIENIIDKLPTAYDVSKVVAELEERRSEYEVYAENAPDEELRAYRKGVMRGCEYSQDIVKRGGVE